MPDKKLFIFLIVGFFAIAFINISKNESNYYESSKQIRTKHTMLMVKSNGLVLSKTKDKVVLRKQKLSIFRKEGGDYNRLSIYNNPLFNDIFEILEKEEKQKDFYQPLILRLHRRYGNTKTYQAQYSSFFNRNKGRLTIIETNDEKVFKMESVQPFQINGFEIQSFKSYQIQDKSETILNTEIFFTKKSEDYKLIINSVYSI